ncbi:FliA/WhiG family RNA polymerase sigma factor [Shewanella sp. A25]|nr:FliA/WhiG family RNA polymerase sigma factor [Shewanella shenzhenensis]
MLEQMQWQEVGEAISSQPVAGESSALNRYGYIVKRAVAHMRSHIGVVADRDDLQQIGMMALLKAIRRYGRDQDEQFESYAFKHVRGAMLDEFRRLDLRSRQSRQEAHQFRDAVRALRRQLGREPRDGEICEKLGLSAQALQKLRYSEQAEVVECFEDLLESQGELAGVSEDMQQADTQRLLKQAMASLPTRNKLLLQLYYTHELNMKEIALTLDLTESRVCQLHKQSLELLMQKLTN